MSNIPSLVLEIGIPSFVSVVLFFVYMCCGDYFKLSKIFNKEEKKENDEDFIELKISTKDINNNDKIKKEVENFKKNVRSASPIVKKQVEKSIRDLFNDDDVEKGLNIKKVKDIKKNEIV